MADWVRMVLCKLETLSLVSSSQVKSQSRPSAPVPRCWEGVLTSRFLDLVISQPSQCVSFTFLRAPVWRQYDGDSREDTRSGLCVCTYWCSHPHTRTCTTTHTHRPDNVCGPCLVCWRTLEIHLPCIPGSCLLSVRGTSEKLRGSLLQRARFHLKSECRFPERVPYYRLSFLGFRWFWGLWSRLQRPKVLLSGHGVSHFFVWGFGLTGLTWWCWWSCCNPEPIWLVLSPAVGVRWTWWGFFIVFIPSWLLLLVVRSFLCSLPSLGNSPSPPGHTERQPKLARLWSLHLFTEISFIFILGLLYAHLLKSFQFFKICSVYLTWVDDRIWKKV